MNKRKKIMALALCGTLLSSNYCIVHAETQNLSSQTNLNNIQSCEKENSEFKELDQETINGMKERFYNEPEDLPLIQPRFSEPILVTLAALGLDNSTQCLGWALYGKGNVMTVGSGSQMASDIWQYSPDFSAKLNSFIKEARSSGSHEFFRSGRTMTFTCPSGSTSQILKNTNTKKQFDLFGSLHTVDINFGAVKSGGKWDLLIEISDTYDFKYENYERIAQYANNIAYLDQIVGKVKKYKININASKGRLNTLPGGYDW